MRRRLSSNTKGTKKLAAFDHLIAQESELRPPALSLAFVSRGNPDDSIHVRSIQRQMYEAVKATIRDENVRDRMWQVCEEVLDRMHRNAKNFIYRTR